MTQSVMRCKLRLNCKETLDFPGQAPNEVTVRMQFGIIPESTLAAQQASENIIFGTENPQVSFSATIKNPAIANSMHAGNYYYVDFIPV